MLLLFGAHDDVTPDGKLIDEVPKDFVGPYTP
jgi:hypothetical protein